MLMSLSLSISILQVGETPVYSILIRKAKDGLSHLQEKERS
jgi:hypothetical protein